MSMPAEILRAERRRSQRQTVSRMVTIEPSPNVPGHEALVTNLSNGGARLFVRDIALPDQSALVFGDTHERRECQVIWRIGPELGVEFIHPPRKPRARKFATRTPVTVKTVSIQPVGAKTAKANTTTAKIAGAKTAKTKTAKAKVAQAKRDKPARITTATKVVKPRTAKAAKPKV